MTHGSRMEYAAASAVALIYGIGTFVQLGGVGDTLTLAWLGVDVEPLHAGIASLLAYVVLLALPVARRWSRYEVWERSVIAGIPILLACVALSPAVHAIATMTPAVAAVIWIISLFAGAVMLA